MATTTLPVKSIVTKGGEDGILLVIHGGAGGRGRHSTPERVAQTRKDLERALEAGYAQLEAGASAEEAVVAAVHVMEDAPEFNAGRGAALTSDGIAQMDACLMGGDGEVGAVTGVRTVKNPIDAARAVKEQTKHVLFAEPQDKELEDWGVETREESYFITEQRKQSLLEAQRDGDEWEKHGTIGAVARDAQGHLAAATSTGGITNQMHGRVGDTPLPGCGTYANDETVAASGTGIGEAYIRTVACHQVSERVRFAKQSALDSASDTLDDIAAHRGYGGLIVLPAKGEGVIAYNSEMMNCGYQSPTDSYVQA
ncbi:isoaspartyl peptidase/L-asparaginase family protein [Bifidobacterium sp. ESL0800]|uniref:isoaspartyl peptidase/L-asparaginase family protein n=1 Tax=Bifidobacterium sp. ESL0800 TaxID=2983236 RepID=UPI0023F9DA53|nr:isoaspartyl peptidase/L-asparaginase family protein [Bifidobacterium sp. ESL0800]WEV75057.1 isoaspartyl peptidase/L-asparaginase family protein [Bifidobacterium sp. ESL0800]